MAEQVYYAPTEAQIGEQATPARFDVYRAALDTIMKDVAARIDYLQVDWLGLAFEIIQAHRRSVDAGELGLTFEDVYSETADDADRRQRVQAAITTSHRYTLQSMRVQTLYNDLLQELGSGAQRISANIPNGIDIDAIYREAVALQEKAIESAVLDVLKCRLKIVLLRRFVYALSNAVLRPQYTRFATAVDNLLVPQPRDLEQYALQTEKPTFLSVDPMNRAPLQSAMVDELTYQLELSRQPKTATVGSIGLEIKNEQTLAEEKLANLWARAERTTRILLITTEYDRSQVRAAYGVALEGVWSNLLRKWIDLVKKSGSLDVLETAFTAVVVERLRQSVGILDSYANAAPLLAERLDIAGVPKKRDYRLLLFSPSGQSFLRYYRLLLALGTKGAADKELTQFASIVPYESALVDYPPVDDKPEIPSRILEGDGELAGLGPEHDKLDQVEIFFERQMLDSGRNEWDWAYKYWETLQRDKANRTSSQKEEDKIRLESARARLEQQQLRLAAAKAK